MQRLILCPEHDLPSAAERLELVEQQSDDAADALVRVHLDLPDLVPAITWWKTELQLASQRLRIPRRKPALAQQAQFIFGHSPLQSEQEAVIDQAGIVRPIRVDHQRSDQGAEIDQVVPVTPIARQARSFQAKHRANRTRADQGNQLLKAGTFDQSGSGATEIVIDHGDGGESDRSRRLDQCVLPPLALSMFGDLPRGGLADIDHSAAPKMIRRDLRRHHMFPVGSGSL